MDGRPPADGRALRPRRLLERSAGTTIGWRLTPRPHRHEEASGGAASLLESPSESLPTMACKLSPARHFTLSSSHSLW